MSDNPWVVVAATVGRSSRSARSSSRSSSPRSPPSGTGWRRPRPPAAPPAPRCATPSELTLLLAGSQLGITAATLALGAISKPAVHHWLTPLFDDWGLPLVAADVAGFVLALLIVTFIHLVVGEMAPKSWAIAHPERSATLLALPMRAFMALFRPLLRALNAAANRLLRRVGVDAVDELAVGHSPDALRHLVEHSADVGALDASSPRRSPACWSWSSSPSASWSTRPRAPAAVPADATAGDVRRPPGAPATCASSPADGERIAGVVHVRDTLTAPDDAPAASFARPVFALGPAPPCTRRSRRCGSPATTSRWSPTEATDGVVGVITLADVLRRLFPQPVTTAAWPTGRRTNRTGRMTSCVPW